MVIRIGGLTVLFLPLPQDRGFCFTPLGSCAGRGIWRGMAPRRIKKGGMKRKDTDVDSPRPTFAGRVSKEDVEGESSWILFILYIRFRDFAIAFAVSPQQIFDYVRGVRHGLFSSLSEI